MIGVALSISLVEIGDLAAACSSSDSPTLGEIGIAKRCLKDEIDRAPPNPLPLARNGLHKSHPRILVVQRADLREVEQSLQRKTSSAPCIADKLRQPRPDQNLAAVAAALSYGCP